MGLGLPPALAASLLPILSAFLAFYFLRRVSLYTPLGKRALLFFALTAAAAPYLGPDLPYIVFSTVIAAVLAPKDVSERRAYVLVAILLFPSFYMYRIPFPGLNYLVDFSLWLFLVLRYLSPFSVKGFRSTNFRDLLFYIFVFLVIVLDFRGVSITEGLRRGMMTVAWYLVPYLAFRVGADDCNGLKKIWEALLIVAVVLAAANVFVQLVRWDFFFFHTPINVESRFGLIRANITLSTGLFGFICATGILALIYFPSLIKPGSIFRLSIYGILFLGVLSSGARAAILSLPLMLLIALMLKWFNPRIVASLVTLLAAGHSVIIDSVLRFDFSRFVDPFNLEYRQRLIATALQQIGEYPIFGSEDFIANPRFLPLIQGQGIVDIVNSYLQIALEYGLIALVCFLGAFLLGIVRLASKIEPGNTESAHRSLLLAVSVGYLFLIATTSMTSYVGLLGIILLGVISAETTHARNHGGRSP